MLFPMMVAAIYTSALIFGPAFVIILAVCLAFLVRFPSFKGWVGIGMVVIGFLEIL